MWVCDCGLGGFGCLGLAFVRVWGFEGYVGVPEGSVLCSVGIKEYIYIYRFKASWRL